MSNKEVVNGLIGFSAGFFTGCLLDSSDPVQPEDVILRYRNLPLRLSNGNYTIPAVVHGNPTLSAIPPVKSSDGTDLITFTSTLQSNTFNVESSATPHFLDLIENGNLVDDYIIIGGIPYHDGDNVPLFYIKEGERLWFVGGTVTFDTSVSFSNMCMVLPQGFGPHVPSKTFPIAGPGVRGYTLNVNPVGNLYGSYLGDDTLLDVGIPGSSFPVPTGYPAIIQDMSGNNFELTITLILLGFVVRNGGTFCSYLQNTNGDKAFVESTLSMNGDVMIIVNPSTTNIFRSGGIEIPEGTTRTTPTNINGVVYDTVEYNGNVIATVDGVTVTFTPVRVGSSSYYEADPNFVVVNVNGTIMTTTTPVFTSGGVSVNLNTNTVNGNVYHRSTSNGIIQLVPFSDVLRVGLVEIPMGDSYEDEITINGVEYVDVQFLSNGDVEMITSDGVGVIYTPTLDTVVGDTRYHVLPQFYVVIVNGVVVIGDSDVFIDPVLGEIDIPNGTVDGVAFPKTTVNGITYLTESVDVFRYDALEIPKSTTHSTSTVLNGVTYTQLSFNTDGTITGQLGDSRSVVFTPLFEETVGNVSYYGMDPNMIVVSIDGDIVVATSATFTDPTYGVVNTTTGMVGGVQYERTVVGGVITLEPMDPPTTVFRFHPNELAVDDSFAGPVTINGIEWSNILHDSTGVSGEYQGERIQFTLSTVEVDGSITYVSMHEDFTLVIYNEEMITTISPVFTNGGRSFNLNNSTVNGIPVNHVLDNGVHVLTTLPPLSFDGNIIARGSSISNVEAFDVTFSTVTYAANGSVQMTLPGGTVLTLPSSELSWDSEINSWYVESLLIVDVDGTKFIFPPNATVHDQPGVGVVDLDVYTVNGIPYDSSVVDGITTLTSISSLLIVDDQYLRIGDTVVENYRSVPYDSITFTSVSAVTFGFTMLNDTAVTFIVVPSESNTVGNTTFYELPMFYPIVIGTDIIVATSSPTYTHPTLGVIDTENNTVGGVTMDVTVYNSVPHFTPQLSAVYLFDNQYPVFGPFPPSFTVNGVQYVTLEHPDPLDFLNIRLTTSTGVVVDTAVTLSYTADGVDVYSPPMFRVVVIGNDTVIVPNNMYDHPTFGVIDYVNGTVNDVEYTVVVNNGIYIMTIKDILHLTMLNNGVLTTHQIVRGQTAPYAMGFDYDNNPTAIIAANANIMFNSEWVVTSVTIMDTLMPFHIPITSVNDHNYHATIIVPYTMVFPVSDTMIAVASSSNTPWGTVQVISVTGNNAMISLLDGNPRAAVARGKIIFAERLINLSGSGDATPIISGQPIPAQFSITSGNPYPAGTKIFFKYPWAWTDDLPNFMARPTGRIYFPLNQVSPGEYRIAFNNLTPTSGVRLVNTIDINGQWTATHVATNEGTETHRRLHPDTPGWGDALYSYHLGTGGYRLNGMLLIPQPTLHHHMLIVNMTAP